MKFVWSVLIQDDDCSNCEEDDEENEKDKAEQYTTHSTTDTCFLDSVRKIKDKKDEKHFILTVHRCQRKEKTRKNASTQATILARLEGEKDEENELILL